MPFLSCSPRHPAAPVLTRVEEAIFAALADFDSIPPGRLIRLRVPVPAAELPPIAALRGDTRWWTGSEAATWCGTGRAVQLESSGPGALITLASDLGRLQGRDTTFFVASSAGDHALAWLPLVLAHNRGGETALTFTARRPIGPLSSLARNWLEAMDDLLAPGPSASGRTLRRLSESPSAEDWCERVAAATRTIAAGHLDKVVLARRITVELSGPLDMGAAIARLAADYPGCNAFALPHGLGTVLAASPERVAIRRNGRLESHALAGTARRHTEAAEDSAAADRLLGDGKERHEHAIVVSAIASVMAELCHHVEPPQAPRVMRLPTVQHLWTPVSGRPRPGIGLLEAAARLHPTPAIAGFPRDKALDWLAGIGEHRDGLYGGIAGWIDPDGDGEAAVVLRSAHVEGRTATLWAGAGIVAGSDCQAELAETEMKLAAMLEILGNG